MPKNVQALTYPRIWIRKFTPTGCEIVNKLIPCLPVLLTSLFQSNFCFDLTVTHLANSACSIGVKKPLLAGIILTLRNLTSILLYSSMTECVSHICMIIVKGVGVE